MRKTIIAGHWKMNMTADDAVSFVNEFKPLVADETDVEIVICPIFTALSAAVDSNVGIGAQNIHWEKSGAFTGEISAPMLKETGVKYVIIGHSERRQYFGETDDTVNLRLKAALAADLVPMVCVGELLEERESDKTEAVLSTQLKGGLAGIFSADMGKIVIAYEPVWAIGTGKTATPEMAQETHSFIRKTLASIFDAKTADVVRIQYGGSMKPANSAELIAQVDIDGGLVGGASLKPELFAELIKNASR